MQVPANPPKLSAPIDQERVRALFARPERVAPSDFLRREVASRMFERLELVKLAPQRVLDAGCGAGADLPLLQKSYPAAHILGLDAAPAMLRAAQAQGPAAKASSLNQLLSKLLPAKTGVDLLCGDFAELPLGPNSLDLVWSNLALHWHPQPDRVFAEWRRVLRVNSLLMFSCFGPDTLRELRAAFAEADLAQHALPFVDMHDFGDQLVEAGFSTPVLDMEVITVTYDTPQALLADVRALGGNPLGTLSRGLMGKQAWRRMLATLEKGRRADGKLGLTFEVIYGHAFRPAPKVTSKGEAIIRFDLPRKPRQ
ncbi:MULTISPECIES: methyltransferase domain-containing protein [unclassified Duganella]|uniref:methyltransferase domain-containing protein n=1 Tax=unclassified Duganella TaxID=2636909 RepID=UPI0008746B26|nr:MULTISPECIES: methyltransferase domain-containing protein [unclassified Duganella]OEZ62621.1 malonyl-[acyl-carrier protein] O-methyltransferase [Duganella sp. HH105]OFA06071.1 malonyl-[acyl-carrier protein] O-methyltransferase [Duganella sp. HH101]